MYLIKFHCKTFQIFLSASTVFTSNRILGNPPISQTDSVVLIMSLDFCLIFYYNEDFHVGHTQDNSSVSCYKSD